MKCKTSKASFVAAWLFSSSDTIPRQKSDESTSVGLKCLRAKEDFPEPYGPIKTTRDSSGIVSFIQLLLAARSDPENLKLHFQGQTPSVSGRPRKRIDARKRLATNFTNYTNFL